MNRYSINQPANEKGVANKLSSQVKELFELYDKDKDDSLSLEELAAMLQDIGSKITTLPAVRFLILSERQATA